eukprot:gnl/TRDRNA2_/TRDRNA2_175468_c5_seq35.p1 gnl/TRDRNA2_/TRDRNA2_175468_c5~~gnl/TRDRNA2_/TRDRNA2_175468_c5_seq35.p1  ORF type:complete len:762 (+),score=129.86 gnl/TRDRNA2_/TRDRNA2_175468_c5_seq35:82-2367(+)
MPRIPNRDIRRAQAANGPQQSFLHGCIWSHPAPPIMSDEERNHHLPVEVEEKIVHEQLQNEDNGHEPHIGDRACARLQRSVDLLDWEVRQMEILIRHQQDILSKTLGMQHQLLQSLGQNHGTRPVQVGQEVASLQPRAGGKESSDFQNNLRLHLAHLESSLLFEHDKLVANGGLSTELSSQTRLDTRGTAMSYSPSLSTRTAPAPELTSSNSALHTANNGSASAPSVLPQLYSPPPFEVASPPELKDSSAKAALQRLTSRQLKALETLCIEFSHGSSATGCLEPDTAAATQQLVPLARPAVQRQVSPQSEGQAVQRQASTQSKGDGERRQLQKAMSSKGKGLFEGSNTDAIKAKVREKKVKPKPYNVHDRYKTQGFFPWLAKHERFEKCTLAVIVINALWISIDTDGNTADTILDAETVYVVADSMFFIYFSIEVFVRFLAFKNKRDCLRDGWFTFDSTLVTLYAFDPFGIGILVMVKGGGGLNLPTSILRLFRLARLSRLVRMLRSLPELMVMIKGMVTAAASVGYTLGLLLIVTYVFSIALRNLVPADSNIEETYFSSVPEAMHNLIIFATFLDNLSDFIFDIKAESPICLIVAWLYIALASLTVMNMLIGVLCEVISAVAAEENESAMVDKVNEQFGRIVEQLDDNCDGEISWEEFQGILEFPAALRALENMNVDAESLIEMAEDFFFEDGEPVQVSFGEFMNMMLDLRGGQSATVKDVMSLGKRVTGKFRSVAQKVDTVDLKLETILDLMSRNSTLQ